MQNFIKPIISAIKFWVTEKINEETTPINTEIDSINTELKLTNQNLEEQLKNSTADWTINNESSSAYIKNRPFYENTERIIFWNFECFGVSNVTTQLFPNYPFEYFKNKLVANSSTSKAVPLEEDNNADELFAKFPDGEKLYIHKEDDSTVRLTLEHDYEKTGSGAIYLITNDIQTLDEKFIPDTIARQTAVDTKITSPTEESAVGQVLSVKAVGENDTPTEWETTSIPTKVSELENDSGFLTEQIQPDWNQNDEATKDHIKNRTHYTYNAKTPILEANGLIIDSDGGYVQIGTLDSMLTIGETYYVTLNDITYECVAREYNDYGSNAIIGNGTIYGDGNEGNGEPFSCDSYTDGSIYLNAETAGTYNIKIEAMRETIKQLDEKYIADIVTRIYNDMAFNISSSSIRRFTTYIDVSTNEEYIVYVDNGTLVSERKITEEDLIDFTYTVEPDGSYTLLTWKGTLNGEPSTEIVIPNSVMINLIQEVK